MFKTQIGVYLGVKTCEFSLGFVAIVRVRVYYVDLFVFFVLRDWSVLQFFTPRMSHKSNLNATELNRRVHQSN